MGVACQRASMSPTKRGPTALLLGDYRKPMNLNLGEEPILIGHELLSGLTVHVSLASGLIIEGIEDEIGAGLAFVLRCMPRDRAGLFTHQLGFPLKERFDFRFLTGFGLQLQEKRELGIHSIFVWFVGFILWFVCRTAFPSSGDVPKLIGSLLLWK